MKLSRNQAMCIQLGSVALNTALCCYAGSLLNNPTSWLNNAKFALCGTGIALNTFWQIRTDGNQSMTLRHLERNNHSPASRNYIEPYWMTFSNVMSSVFGGYFTNTALKGVACAVNVCAIGLLGHSSYHTGKKLEQAQRDVSLQYAKRLRTPATVDHTTIENLIR